MERKKIFGILATIVIVCLTAGCGDDEAAVQADAQTQIVEPEEMAVVEEGGESEERSAAEPDTTGVDGQAESASGAQTEPEGQTGNVSGVQTELDEMTRNQLTEELLEENQMDTSVIENPRATKGCTFLVPEAFVEAEDVEGMYVTERYPIDASVIYYVALEQDIALQLMTEETFKTQTEENFREMYGEDIEITIDSFERMKIDGYPAFRILCHYQIDEIEITQLEYAINADKSYIITYSQTSDYDRMEEYEASAATIRLEY